MDSERGHTIFIYDKIKVFFKHTDYHGFVHPYNFLEWMSYAREAFFKNVLPTYQLESNRSINMVTVRMECDYLADARFGDDIEILIFTEHVKRFSFDVVFEFYRRPSQELLGIGRQTIAFLQSETAKPSSIPEGLYIEIKKGERKGVARYG